MERPHQLDAQLAVNSLAREAAGAVRRHLVTFAEEVAREFVHVVVHCAVRHVAGSVCEVRCSSTEHRIQAVSDSLPWLHVPAAKVSSQLALQPLNALLRGLR